MTYLKMVKRDIKNSIEQGFYDEIINNTIKSDKVKMYSLLLKEMWNDECITGNSCGGYYFQTTNAREMVTKNLEEVKKAYDFFDYYLSKDLIDDDYCAIDSQTRCYFLINVLHEVLKEMQII